jgi:hypothetical protein
MKIVRLHILVLAAMFVFCSPSFAVSAVQQKVVEVPFSYERGQVFVEVKLSGLAATYPMMLNTGVGRSVFSHSVAKAAGLVITLSNPNAWDYDKRYSLDALVRRMEIGELEFGNLNVAVSAKEGVAGILGNDFLKQYVTQIDFPKRVVRFYQSSPFPKGAASVEGTKAVLKMKFDGRVQVPIVEEVYVNGKAIKVSLDTGFSETLALTPAAIKYLGLKSMDDTKTKREERKLETLAVGTLKLDSPIVVLYGKGSGFEMSLETMGGVIGTGFMESYVVTFDFKNKAVVFE